MKKKYLTYAGIISAAILVIMFGGILLSGSFARFAPITINPLPEHAVGDRMVLSGETNLMAGTVIELDITEVSPLTGTEPRKRTVDALIVRGAGSANTWSRELETSAFPPGEYLVNACWINETAKSDILATSRFRLTERTPAQAGSSETPFVTTKAEAIKSPVPAPTDTGQCQIITIDPFPDQWVNQSYTISGTTSFAPGTGLLVKVFTTENALTVNPGIKHPASSMSGAMGAILVEKGNGTKNTWSVTLGKGQMDPGQRNYLVNVSNDRIDNRTYETLSGDTFCSRRLVLPE